MKRRLLVLLSLLMVFEGASLLASPPEVQARIQGGQGGRIYDPKRLRRRAERPPRGRILKDPRKGPADAERQPARRRAIIPNPEKRHKGGSGYTKRGQYYYETPANIRFGGNPRRRVERVTIPHPNKKLR